MGDGQCFSLADRALSNAGAKSAAAYTELTPDGDYIWGTPIRLADARPGDILQFRGFRMVKRITTTTRTADGSIYRTQTEQSEDRDHHTAIVAENLGNSLSILEQNVDPQGGVVQRHQIEIAAGTRNESDATDGSQVTTEIFIDGQIWAYRPQRANVAYAALSPQS